MTVGSYTYGTVAGVHRRVSWVIPGSEMFSANTSPSLTDVESILDDVAAEIHAKLYEAGYPVKTKTDLTTASARAAAWLQALNEVGACAQLLQGFAVANNPENDEAHPEAFWKKNYENGLKLIAGAFLDRAGLTREHALSELLVCTSILDEEGVEKAPLFTRNMWAGDGDDEALEVESES